MMCNHHEQDEDRRPIQKGDLVRLKRKLSALNEGETVRVVLAHYSGGYSLESIGCGPRHMGYALAKDIELVS